MKKWLAILVSLMLTCGLLMVGTVAVSADTSGTTGDCTWTLDGTTLTISGNGAMGSNGSDYWYGYGTNITKVVIKSGVTSIGYEAFYNCTKLTSVTIPSSVTQIGSYAFYNCTALKSISIPKSVTSIDHKAFYGCTGLTSVTIPSSVKTIGSSAFYNCTGLKSVTIPSSVTYIDDYTFYNCTALTSVTIPKSVTYIDSEAFYGCTGLKTVTIASDKTGVYSSAFSGCTNVTSATIGSCKWSVSGKTLTVSGKGTIDRTVPYPNTITKVVIKSGITEIGSSAFYGFTKLTSISIPNSVTYIGSYAFSGCTGLKTVTIASANTDVYSSAFDRCTNITSATVGSNKWSLSGKTLTVSGKGTIDRTVPYPTTITKVIIKSGVTEIGSAAFAGFTKLTSVSIPNTVTYIGFDAFSYCTALKSISIPKSVTSIDPYAFSGCTGLTSISIPKSVKSVGDGAFSGCTALKTVTVASADTLFDNYYADAFRNCPKITTATVGSCKWSLSGKTLTVSGKGTINDKVPYPATITKVVIKSGITEIGSSAFYGFTKLTSVTIPKTVTSINSNAFRNCTGLKTISIPKSVESIDYNAFYGCTALKTVTIANAKASVSYDAFYDCKKITTATVGSCKWSLSGKTLTVSGKGTINDQVPYPATITKVIIKSGVTEIGSEAFFRFAKLTSVTIPKTVETIGSAAFYGCTGIKSITIPGSVTGIGVSAFSGCTALTSIKIPSSVKTVGDYAFNGCTKLKSATIADTVRSIGYEVFTDTALYKTTSKWTKGVLYIGKHLIKAKDTVTGKYTVKAGTKTIAAQAFKGCDELTSVVIPDSVLYVRDSAFYGCKKLKTITIGKGAKVFPSVYNCSALTNVYVSNCYQMMKFIGNFADANVSLSDPRKAHTYKTYTTKATLTKNGSTEKCCSICGVSAGTTTISRVKSVTLSATKYTYNGKQKTPTVVVKDASGKVLKKGVDYTVTYASGRKKAGTYKVTVKFKGNYSGSKTLTFRIVK